jgi:hypothetical protein
MDGLARKTTFKSTAFRIACCIFFRAPYRQKLSLPHQPHKMSMSHITLLTLFIVIWSHCRLSFITRAAQRSSRASLSSDNHFPPYHHHHHQSGVISHHESGLQFSWFKMNKMLLFLCHHVTDFYMLHCREWYYTYIAWWLWFSFVVSEEICNMEALMSVTTAVGNLPRFLY